MTASDEMTAPAAARATPLLDVDAVSKHFGGVTALDEVSLQIRRGEIYGLIGPNGAGKTTLFNVITGLYVPESGRVKVDGQAIMGLKPHAVVARGIARTFQNIRLFANMTALENVMVGRHVRTHAGVLGAVLRDERTRAEEEGMAAHAHALLERVGLGARGNVLARHLAYGEQRRLEIARALATEPKLLALDEPVAGMNATETARMMELLGGLRADGATLLLIEHDMRLVMGLCDRVGVLDYGKLIAEGQPPEVQRNARVIEAYLGGPLG